MAKLSKKKRSDLINSAYGQYCSGIQVPILKLGAIFKAGEAALDAGGDLAAVGAALKESALQVAVNRCSNCG